MTRKFVYDPRVERVRLVAWTTASYRALSPRQRGSVPWIVAVLVIVASVLALDAAYASSQAEIAPAALPASR